jgi:hypothetical protein
MDVDIHFLYTQFINLSRDVQFIYVYSGTLTTTPLDHARSNGHGAVVQLLNSYGAIAYGLLD